VSEEKFTLDEMRDLFSDFTKEIGGSCAAREKWYHEGFSDGDSTMRKLIGFELKKNRHVLSGCIGNISAEKLGFSGKLADDSLKVVKTLSVDACDLIVDAILNEVDKIIIGINKIEGKQDE